MKINYTWLKDYIDTALSAEKAAEALTMAGLTVESIRKATDGDILEIEVTSNRPDWLSYVGVARELAAVAGGKLKLPKVKPLPAEKLTDVKITIEDKTLCPRYTARVIRNVKVSASPDWLKKKIESMGLRSVNNIVDITNFCLFETGEPLHAFDLDKIAGSEIIVRKAKPGEKITTIDGVSRELTGSMLVIADKDKPVAVAGVMGGTNTEVTSDTKNILLEAASFDQISIRRTARVLAISTDSSYRFERKVDLNNIVHSSDRAVSLIQEEALGQVCGFQDIGKKETHEKTVTLRLARLSAILGTDIPPAKIKKIVTSLGLKILSSSDGVLKMKPPAFRCDLTAEVDIIEEVARVYGYDKIPSTIPDAVEQDMDIPRDIAAEKKIREVLTGLGACEIITYSLLGKNILNMALAGDADSMAEIKNPLSAEQEIMRPCLMPGMLQAILWNVNRRSKDLRLFELGKIYAKTSGGHFIEEKMLSIGIAGEVSTWMESARKLGFFDLKGCVETVAEELGVGGLAFQRARNNIFSPSSAATIELDGRKVGTAGEVAKSILNNFGIKETVYFCEISLDAICKAAKLKKEFHELSNHPSAFRDISIVVAKEIMNADLASAAKNAAGQILKEVKLVDKYTGKQIPDGKISLTYRLEYADPSRTLEEKEVSSAHANILRALGEKYGAKLR